VTEKIKIGKVIVCALKGGDQEAFAKIIDAYSEKLYSFCFAFCKSRVEAEELSQDVFLKVWTARDRLDEDRDIGNYLFTVARNSCLNYLKSHRNQYKIRKVLLDSEVYTSSHNIEDDLVYEEYMSMADQAVQLLPKRCKEIYSLSKREGLNNHAIAQKLNISINTVRAQIVKSNGIVRDFLEKKTGLTLFLLLGVALFQIAIQ